MASRILKESSLAWARDARSFAVLAELLGADFDPTRHSDSVDMAFLLSATKPAPRTIADLADWLEADRPAPTVGINVSGLIYNDARRAEHGFGFRASYPDALRLFVRRLLDETPANVLLVPHVITAAGHYESDPAACEGLARSLGNPERRLRVAPTLGTPGEAKWVIARCDWFCGTRMHSTIAGLSSGVPTCGIAYSPKTLGVFETCGQSLEVADPRIDDTQTLAGKLWASWTRRSATATELRRRLPAVLGRAAATMDRIAEFAERRHANETAKAYQTCRARLG